MEVNDVPVHELIKNFDLVIVIIEVVDRDYAVNIIVIVSYEKHEINEDGHVDVFVVSLELQQPTYFVIELKLLKRHLLSSVVIS